jgi:hypothetical protein
MLTSGGRLYCSHYGPETFKELDDVLSSAGVDSSVVARDFADADELSGALAGFGDYSLERFEMTEEYPSVRVLLAGFRNTGTNPGSAQKGLWTKRTLERIEKEYINRYGAIVATQEIFFCKGVKA